MRGGKYIITLVSAFVTFGVLLSKTKTKMTNLSKPDLTTVTNPHVDALTHQYCCWYEL